MLSSSKPQAGHWKKALILFHFHLSGQEVSRKCMQRGIEGGEGFDSDYSLRIGSRTNRTRLGSEKRKNTQFAARKIFSALIPLRIDFRAYLVAPSENCGEGVTALRRHRKIAPSAEPDRAGTSSGLWHCRGNRARFRICHACDRPLPQIQIFVHPLFLCRGEQCIFEAVGLSRFLLRCAFLTTGKSTDTMLTLMLNSALTDGEELHRRERRCGRVGSMG